MQNKYRFLKLLIPIIFFHSFIIAQESDTTNIFYYFDDGGISNSRNVVKFNTLSILNGDLPVYYEVALNNAFTLEVGAGILLPYYFPKLNFFYDEDFKINNPDFGYSIWVHPKFYGKREAPQNYYIGIQYRRRNFNQDNQEIVYVDYTFNVGMQLIMKDRLIFDYNVGVGYKKDIKDTNSIFAVMPIGIKLGYLF